MSAETTTRTDGRDARETGMPSSLAQFQGVVRSEWTKLWSLRSTPWTMLITFVVTVGFSALASWGAATHLSQADARSGGQLDATSTALSGLLIGQLPVAVLGVLMISSEYSTGAIRSSLVAVPGRIRFLTAKAFVLAAVGALTGVITSFASFYVGRSFFAAHDVAISLGDTHVLRAVIGGGLVIAASGLFGFAVGTLLRHSAGAITVSVAVLFVIPMILGNIPGKVVHEIGKYFFTAAGGQLTNVIDRPGALGAWQGYAVFLAEIAVLLVAGIALAAHRDA